jgi:hypothetical protein
MAMAMLLGNEVLIRLIDDPTDVGTGALLILVVDEALNTEVDDKELSTAPLEDAGIPSADVESLQVRCLTQIYYSSHTR